MDEKKISADASRVYTFALNSINGNKAGRGGNVLTHKPSAYGMVLKWLIFVKGMTYSQFAKLYNGTTAQNLNHFINRADKTRFFAEDIDKMCAVLNVTYDYFIAVSDKVQEKMEA